MVDLVIFMKRRRRRRRRRRRKQSYCPGMLTEPCQLCQLFTEELGTVYLYVSICEMYMELAFQWRATIKLKQLNLNN